jgi:glycosyltransferase involved in cell wall biosynthesis
MKFVRPSLEPTVGLWRTRKGMIRVGLAISRFFRLVVEDVLANLISLAQTLRIDSNLKSLMKRFEQALIHKPVSITYPIYQNIAQTTSAELLYRTSKPVIFVSACKNEKNQGGWKYNGGIKELNYLVKLLRKHEYEAYIVTYDGGYEPWLIEHQPHISLEEFRSLLKTTQDVRCVTSWAIAEAFIRECSQIYFWDMELAWTEHSHFSTLASLYKRKIKRVAAISRTIQAWHMAHFEKSCTVIPNLVDESLWFPIEAQRHPQRVGYMDEGPHTEEYITIVEDVVKSHDLELEFLLIKGCEADVLSSMRSCEIFLTMNIGKDPLWGEGGPLTPLEALATGCVPITFDILGPREIIQSGFNGIVVPPCRPDRMANALVSLYKKPGEIERIRKNALSLLNACHTFDARWPAVKEFLELDDL